MGVGRARGVVTVVLVAVLERIVLVWRLPVFGLAVAVVVFSSWVGRLSSMAVMALLMSVMVVSIKSHRQGPSAGATVASSSAADGPVVLLLETG
jgi:hypothetical protein